MKRKDPKACTTRTGSRAAFLPIEKGTPTVSIGPYADVLHTLNSMDTDLLLVVKDDASSRKLRAPALPAKRQAPKKGRQPMAQNEKAICVYENQEEPPSLLGRLRCVPLRMLRSGCHSPSAPFLRTRIWLFAASSSMCRRANSFSACLPAPARTAGAAR